MGDLKKVTPEAVRQAMEERYAAAIQYLERAVARAREEIKQEIDGQRTAVATLETAASAELTNLIAHAEVAQVVDFETEVRSGSGPIALLQQGNAGFKLHGCWRDRIEFDGATIPPGRHRLILLVLPQEAPPR